VRQPQSSGRSPEIRAAFQNSSSSANQKDSIHTTLQCDEVLVAPESVASILERETRFAIQTWFELVEQDAELACIPLTCEERTVHLPKLFQDLIRRLRLNPGLPASISLAARNHGEMRCGQGYTATMMVDEARFLEVSIFATLHRNRCRMDCRQVLADIATIADEINSQLKQSMFSYVTFPMVMKSWLEGLPEKSTRRESARATLARVKKEMALPRVAASARQGSRVRPKRRIQ
jgi:hypothetical protein